MAKVKVSKRAEEFNKEVVKFKEMMSQLIYPFPHRSPTGPNTEYNKMLFRDFCKNYPTNNRFKDFMDKVPLDMEDPEDKKISIFRSEYSNLFKPSLTGSKYRNYLVYNDNALRGTFDFFRAKYFPKLLDKKYYIKVKKKENIGQNSNLVVAGGVIKSKSGMKQEKLKQLALKNEKRIAKGKKPIKLKKLKKAKTEFKYETSFTHYYLHANGKSLKEDYITVFTIGEEVKRKSKPIRNVRGKKKHSRFIEKKVTWQTTKMKVQKNEVEAHYGILKSYFQKVQAKVNRDMLSKYSGKKEAQRTKAARIKKFEKFEDTHGMNIPKLVNYCCSVTGQIYDYSLVYKKEKGTYNYDMLMTYAFKVAQGDKMRSLYKMLDNDNPMLKKRKEKLAKLFIKALNRKLD